MSKILFLSIKPKYAELYKFNIKTIELRKIKPNLSSGDFVFFYVSSPKKHLGLIGEVKEIIAKKPTEIWDIYQENTGMNEAEYYNYFQQNALAFGILFKKIVPLVEPIDLNELKKIIPNFVPPQSFIYYDKTLFNLELFGNYLYYFYPEYK